MAAWIAPDDLPRLAAALGPAADVVLCDLLATLAAVVRGGAAAAVLGPAALTCEDVADLAALLVEHPTTVFAGIAPSLVGAEGAAGVLAVVAAESRRGRAAVLAFGRPADDADWALLSRSLACARLADPVQRACVAAVLPEV